MTEALENKDIVQVSVYLVTEQENLQRILPENQLFHYRPEKLQKKLPRPQESEEIMLIC